jgi:hypothetical protein
MYQPAPSLYRHSREGGKRLSAAERLIIQGRCFAFGFGPLAKKAKAFASGELPFFACARAPQERRRTAEPARRARHKDVPRKER